MKSTEIYRTPLPFASIEEHTVNVMSSSLVFPCYFHFVFAEKKNLVGNENFTVQGLEEAVLAISKVMHHLVREKNSSYSGCGSSFVVMASLDSRNRCLRVGVPEGFPVWPCGLMNSKLLDVMEQNDDDTMDEFLSNYSHGIFTSQPQDDSWRKVASGIYTILSLNNLHHGIPQSILEVGPTEGHTPALLPSLSKAVIGKYRHAWFVANREDNIIGDKELAVMSDIAVRFFMNGGSYQHQSRMSIEEKGEAMPLAADGKAILSFSLLNAEPKDWIFNWDFNELEGHFLAPIIKALRPVADLNVESQVLYYTPSSVRSFWDPNLQKHMVFSKDLPFFVNANEWHLDTSSAAAGRSKLLHLAIYVPAVDECPLHLKQQDGSLSRTNGFTSPGWGGVAIFNPPKCNRNSNASVQHLSIKDLKPVIRVLIAQIRILFGLPPATSMDDDTNFVCVPAVNTAFSDWELDVLLRRRAAADLASFASTLRSLSRLVQSLPNMVIMEEIGDQVRSSLLAAAAAEQNASLGLYSEAAEAARKARALAEEAFFQPSIMSLLYLPLEHHFAIYTPFFVPVLLHTVLAAVKEIRRYSRERRNFLFQRVQPINLSE